MRVSQEKANKIIDIYASKLSKDASYCQLVKDKRNQAFAITANLQVADKATGTMFPIIEVIGESNVGEILNNVESYRLQALVGVIKTEFSIEPETQEESEEA